MVAISRCAIARRVAWKWCSACHAKRPWLDQLLRQKQAAVREYIAQAAIRKRTFLAAAAARPQPAQLGIGGRLQLQRDVANLEVLVQFLLGLVQQGTGVRILTV